MAAHVPNKRSELVPLTLGSDHRRGYALSRETATPFNALVRIFQLLHCYLTLLTSFWKLGLWQCALLLIFRLGSKSIKT